MMSEQGREGSGKAADAAHNGLCVTRASQPNVRHGCQTGKVSHTQSSIASACSDAEMSQRCRGHQRLSVDAQVCFAGRNLSLSDGTFNLSVSLPVIRDSVLRPFPASWIEGLAFNFRYNTSGVSVDVDVDVAVGVHMDVGVDVEVDLDMDMEVEVGSESDSGPEVDMDIDVDVKVDVAVNMDA